MGKYAEIRPIIKGGLYDLMPRLRLGIYKVNNPPIYFEDNGIVLFNFKYRIVLEIGILGWMVRLRNYKIKW